MAGEQDSWMQSLGVDLAKLGALAGSAPPGGIGKPLEAGDPAQRQALADTVVELGKGFVKGVNDTAGGFVNSTAGQFAIGEINPLAPTLTRAVDAAVTGDASKLAGPDPSDGIRNFDPNDPKQQQQAQASVRSAKDQALGLLGIIDPVALATDSADVLVNGDPNLVGQGAGKVFVTVGPGLAAGGLAGLAEGGVAEAGTAEAGAAKPPVSPPVGELPQPPSPISRLDSAFGDVPAPQAPAPVSSLNPALGEPIPPAESGPGDSGFPFEKNGPNSSPFTPRPPSVPGSGELPAPAGDPATPSVPPAAEPQPPVEIPPISSLPDLNVPPPELPPGVRPGFPFGVDPPSE